MVLIHVTRTHPRLLRDYQIPVGALCQRRCLARVRLPQQTQTVQQELRQDPNAIPEAKFPHDLGLFEGCALIFLLEEPA